MPGFIWAGSPGCLLPFLIFFNLFFGRGIFNSTLLWLEIEAVLVLFFILKIRILARKISSHFEGRSGAQKVVDIQGQVLEEDKKLK